jgi:nicotinamide-nucleotide amidase
MTVALLSIGTELTRGNITNTNGAWLATELTELGFEVTAIDVVDDDRSRIVDALKRLSQTHEFVFCSGGLGPTTDDITTECAAAALGVDLAIHPPSVIAIEKRMARFGRTMAESNRKQAFFPIGATILANDWGTAPGFAVKFGNATVFFTPGVPQEMKSLFVQRIVPLLGLPSDRTPTEIVFRTFGEGESELNDRLSGIETEYDVTIGYRVHFPEVDVKVLARAVEPETARHRAEQASLVVRKRLANCIYGEGKTNLPTVLGQHLDSLKQRFAVAESCTGGLVSSLITENPGVSSWFSGSIVSYANEVKIDVLGVPSELIETRGAVSLEVAKAMAEGVCRVTKSAFGLAITGIAGPTGGSEDKPVGTVCFAVTGPNGTHTYRKLLRGDRPRIQRLAAYHGMRLVLDYFTQLSARNTSER